MKDSYNKFLPPRWVLTLLFVALVFWLTFKLKEILVLLVVGFSISYMVEPILQFFEKKKISRPIGIVFIAVLFIVFLIILFATALPVAFREFSVLIKNLPHYIDTAKNNLIPLLEGYKRYLPIDDLIHSPLDFLSTYAGGLPEKIFSSLSQFLLKGYDVTLTIINLALLPFIVFYISVDFPTLKNGFVKQFPKSLKKKVTQILSELDSYISAFVRGQFIVCTILFLLYSIALGSIGVELWLVLAAISGFGNIVPYVGFVSGITLSSIMTLVTFGDIKHLIIVWLSYALVQFLEGVFITPKILGDRVGLSPLVIIISIVAAGSLFGLLGIFLAIPIAASIRVFIKHAHSWIIKEVN